MTRTVRINRDRLWAALTELKQIGAYDNEATGLRGVRRLALTDACASGTDVLTNAVLRLADQP